MLIQAVKRNIDRFPEDFMFQLKDDEFADLKSQIVISSRGGIRREKPYVFTEQEIAIYPARDYEHIPYQICHMSRAPINHIHVFTEKVPPDLE